jgi:hypothetical protein
MTARGQSKKRKTGSRDTGDVNSLQEPSCIPSDDPAFPGQAAYTPRLLRSYDAAVLGFSNRVVWKCPSRHLLELYDSNVSSSHLDVGPGTGYFLDRCTFPDQDPSITLLDPNSHCLEHAANRLSRYNPKLVQASVLERLDLSGRFQSVGLNYVLHCLPGTMSEKKVVLRHLKPHLAKNGVLFGSTILSGGVSSTLLGRRVLRIYNRKGIFSNDGDDLDGLRRLLDAEFSSHELAVHGSVAIFTARVPSVSNPLVRAVLPGGQPVAHDQLSS